LVDNCEIVRFLVMWRVDRKQNKIRKDN
jgi:hypothetical protein